MDCLVGPLIRRVRGLPAHRDSALRRTASPGLDVKSRFMSFGMYCGAHPRPSEIKIIKVNAQWLMIKAKLYRALFERMRFPELATKTRAELGFDATHLSRVIAKVEWHPGELYPRVGFIVTNMSRPAENAVALLQRARHLRAVDQGSQGHDQMDAAVMSVIRRQRGSSPASCARLQPRQFPADVGDARADQRLVDDEPEREANQDRRESRAP
jgi:hypothetical protein